jgi:hypothetical protein
MMITRSLVWLGCLLVCSSAPAIAEESAPTRLPAGYYLYLGPQPGKADSPRGFHVDSSGKVTWDGSDPPPAARAAEQPQVDDSVQPQYENCESANYPVLNWKPRPVGDVPDGVAKLWTTFDANKIRYKLTLFKVARDAASFRRVQLLDDHGFEVKKITAVDFVPVGDSELLEARGEQYCTPGDYQRIRDYVVK